MLKKFNMTNCKSVSTPIDENISLDNESDDSFDKNVPYRQLQFK